MKSVVSTWPVGRQDTPAFGSDHIEELRWLGKPWRRIELMTNRFFWKGEQTEVTRDLTLHIGFRRLGLGFTFSVMKASVLDYGDEPNV